METEIKVLDKGFVRLEKYMAEDLDVVNAAKVSFLKRAKTIGEAEICLINFLAENHHTSPFEHTAFKFHVKAPIFIFREWHRHRIASYNEWSARYSELKNEYYIPEPENVRRQIGKPGRYRFELVSHDQAIEFINTLVIACKESFENYQWAIDLGIAKEQARLFLNVNIYSEMIVTLNAHSLMHFIKLRNSPQAQWEIQQYGAALEYFFKEIMPNTYNAFNKFMRNLKNG
jgi:thymidylate synthase (FAD)